MFRSQLLLGPLLLSSILYLLLLNSRLPRLILITTIICISLRTTSISIRAHHPRMKEGSARLQGRIKIGLLYCWGATIKRVYCYMSYKPLNNTNLIRYPRGIGLYYFCSLSSDLWFCRNSSTTGVKK